jgi:hypothetical protein
MTAKGAKKPDEYANAFASHPEPELLRFTIPTSSAARPAIRATAAPPPASKKRTEITSTGCGRCFPKKMHRPAARNCHAADMVLASGDVQFQTINDGKDLFRQRGCMGCHRYEGYDKEPEDLNSVGQQIKQIETQKKDNRSSPPL